MVSTPSELNTFFQAVFDGRLLTQASIDEMKKASIWDQEEESTGWASSVLRSVAEAHPGATEVISRAITREVGVGPDGTAVTVAVTAWPSAIADQNNLESSAEEKAGKVDETVDAALCHK